MNRAIFIRDGLSAAGEVAASVPDRRYDLTVLGDLHGCYSCLKAAVLQADFLGKLDAWRAAPDKHPEPKLVFLGDYVDRGMYSYEGVLRAALSLLQSFDPAGIGARDMSECLLLQLRSPDTARLPEAADPKAPTGALIVKPPEDLPAPAAGSPSPPAAPPEK